MKTKFALFLLFAACGGFCLTSCGGDDDNSSGEVNKPATAVDSGVDLSPGKRIFVRDRNYGASAVGKTGTFLQYTQAINACPSGYHLMTRAECNRLQSVYNTAVKMRDGVLRMPLGGYSSGLEAGITGNYWLDQDGYIPPEPNEDSYSALRISTQPQPGFDEVNRLYIAKSSTVAYLARCVKDYD